MREKWEMLPPIEGLVIVVEDDPILRLLTVEILSEIGIRSLEFSTADEAFTHVLSMSDSCPLVIADQGLPGDLQGSDFIELIKE
ncbi:hypothetical protein [Pseudomonas koreensis]|uniref:hypothetical protein n=1 Tax=Pseudomonas koreensis TaxID=198620 RepID=UPI0020C62D92